jgi:Protein of unknown function (DUF1569)
MRTLASSSDRESMLRRISALTASDQRQWGRMSVNQMICHLNDACKLGLGEKSAKSSSTALRRTVMKWFALQVPVKWPRNVKTGPEFEQGLGGTPPVEFERDRAELLALMNRFCDECGQRNLSHPAFGPMTTQEWLRWGYLHNDHHLRQFGR